MFLAFMQDPAASPVLKTQGGEEEAENVPTSPAAVIGSAPSFSSNLQDRARQGSNPQRHPFDSSGSHMQPLHEEAATAVSLSAQTSTWLSSRSLSSKEECMKEDELFKTL